MKTIIAIILISIFPIVKQSENVDNSMFSARLNIVVNPYDAEIYVDNVLRGTGATTVSVGVAKDIEVMVKKEGYVTIINTYTYKKIKGRPNTYDYDRGKNDFTINMIKK